MHYRPAHGSEPDAFQKIVGSIFLVIVLAVWLRVYFFILLAVVGFGFFLHYRIPIFGAFKKSPSTADAVLARKILILLFFLACIAAFVALPYSGNSALYGFLAGSLCYFALYLCGLQLEGAKKTLWTRFLTALIGGLKELALLFAFVAGLYTCATLYLRHTVGDSGTLRQLRLWDDRLLYARTFLSKLKFSAWQTIAVASLFIVLRALEKRLGTPQALIADTGWRAFASGAKWLSRAALLALFAASFTLLATRSNEIGGEIGAHIRDFEEAYTQLRAATEHAVDSQLKREMINQAWKQLAPEEKQAIQQEIGNYAVGLRLSRQYAELRDAFPFRDPSIETALALDRPISLPDVATHSTSEGRFTEAPQAAAQDLSLESIQHLSKEASKLADDIDKAPPPEPVKSISEVIQGKLLDIGFDRLKEQFKFFDVLDAHFPGAGELLDSIWGAGADTLLEQRKEAKAKALKKKLESPDRPIRDVVNEQVASMVQSAGRDKLTGSQARQHLQRAQSRATDLQNAKAALLQKARSIELAALSASNARIAQMESQVDRLRPIDSGKLRFHGMLEDTPDLPTTDPVPNLSAEDKFKSLGIDQNDDEPTATFDEASKPPGRPLELTPPSANLRSRVKVDWSEIWQTTPDTAGNSGLKTGTLLPRIFPPSRSFPSIRVNSFHPSAELRKFSDTDLFSDKALTAKLEKSLDRQKDLEDEIVSIVDRNEKSQLAELKGILGDSFPRFERLSRDKKAQEYGTEYLRGQGRADLPGDLSPIRPGGPRTPGEWDFPGRRPGYPEPYRPEPYRPRAEPRPSFRPVP